MTTKIIFSGFGGQGVLTLGLLVADIALNQGKEVTWMPSYGAEMRGGTANCAVIISDSVIGSPMVQRNVDILVAMNAPSVTKFSDKMREGGGIAFINSSLVADAQFASGVDVVNIDATNLAVKAGNARTANMIMLTGFLAKTNLFTLEDIKAALSRRFEGKEHLVDVNMKALEQAMAGA
ncbi:MAG: 2-oxoacid:acceptor oxidoreductase family protein [Defluviitaleaceae bacterium]|nr:2-oxoacid:acceptor oxidoreductase family protein [Defluviitaleaceae bacterium]